MAEIVAYKELQFGGNSRATEAGKASARRHCNSFCLSKGIGLDGQGVASCEITCNEKFSASLRHT
jgi:hypothetical protein